MVHFKLFQKYLWLATFLIVFITSCIGQDLKDREREDLAFGEPLTKFENYKIDINEENGTEVDYLLTTSLLFTFNPTADNLANIISCLFKITAGDFTAEETVNGADCKPDMPLEHKLRINSLQDITNISGTVAVTYQGGTQKTGSTSVPLVVVRNDNIMVAKGKLLDVTDLILNNDTKPQDGSAEIIILSDPQNGTLEQKQGRYTYTPKDNYEGPDSFSYDLIVKDKRLSDGKGATVNITVKANKPPVAVADEASTTIDESVSIKVTDNDTDEDGDTLKVISVTDGKNGFVQIVNDSTVTYVPDGENSGTDEFTYTITDGTETAMAKVIVNVTNNNKPPVAKTIEESVSTSVFNPNPTITVDIDVIAGDEDPDDDPVEITKVTPSSKGSATIKTDKKSVSLEVPTESGSYIFEYEISDGRGGRAKGTITVNVTITSPRIPIKTDGGPKLGKGSAVNGQSSGILPQALSEKFLVAIDFGDGTANLGNGELLTIDYTDPNDPQILQEHSITPFFFCPGARSIILDGTIVYGLSFNFRQICVNDINNLPQLSTIIGLDGAPGDGALIPNSDTFAITDFENSSLEIRDRPDSTGRGGFLIKKIPLSGNERSCPFSMVATATHAYIVGREGLVGDPTESCNNWRKLFIVDLATDEVTTVDLGIKPRKIVLSADGKTAYISDFDEDKVYVVDLMTETVTKKLDVGDGPVGVDLSADGDLLFVTNWNTNKVQVIRLADGSVLQELDSNGVNPVDVQVDGSTLIVSNFGDEGNISFLEFNTP